MAVAARETEIKYEATAGTSLPSFDDLPQVARTRGAADEKLDAEYFDTGDLGLIRAAQSPKLARALGLPEPEQEPDPGSSLRGSAPAGQVIIGYLSARLGA